jgi:hypothetical protein
MKPDLRSKNVDIADAAKAALKDKEFLLELIKNLKSKKETIRFNSSKVLALISNENPDVLYPYWDFFFALLDGNNTYWKCSGIPIIANLTRVDGENRFEKMFETYYSLLNDKKSFIPAAYLARSSSTIARSKPNLQAKITEKLLRIDKTHHHPQRRDLVKSDIIEAFDEYFEEVEDKTKIVAFVKEQLKCDSPKTRKIAAKFLEKWGGY